MTTLRTLVPALALAIPVLPLHAQRLVERTPNLPNSVSALPGMLEASLTHRFAHAPGVSGVATVPTFDLALGMPFLLPLRWTAGVRFMPAGAAVPRDEWELYDRLGLLRQTRRAPFDLDVTGAYNFTGSLDGELTVARRFGAVRAIGAARVLGSPYDVEETRVAVAAGGVLHVRPPLTLAADFATLTDRAAGEEPAWSAALQLGLAHTPLSLSLHATNAVGTTLAAASIGGRRTRWGIELNAPVEFVGFLLGWYASREHAQRAVAADSLAAPAHVVRIRNYLYTPATLVVRTGDVVEWRNEDDVVHTVTSENGGFDSRGMQPGAIWRARFSEPGRFPYYCGPHPFMKGVVIVR